MTGTVSAIKSGSIGVLHTSGNANDGQGRVLKRKHAVPVAVLVDEARVAAPSYARQRLVAHLTAAATLAGIDKLRPNAAAAFRESHPKITGDADADAQAWVAWSRSALSDARAAGAWEATWRAHRQCGGSTMGRRFFDLAWNQHTSVSRVFCHRWSCPHCSALLARQWSWRVEQQLQRDAKGGYGHPYLLVVVAPMDVLDGASFVDALDDGKRKLGRLLRQMQRRWTDLDFLTSIEIQPSTGKPHWNVLIRSREMQAEDVDAARRWISEAAKKLGLNPVAKGAFGPAVSLEAVSREVCKARQVPLVADPPEYGFKVVSCA